MPSPYMLPPYSPAKRHGCRPLTRRRRLEALDQLERRLVGDERLREGAGARRRRDLAK